MEYESFVELQEAQSPEQSEKEYKRLRVEAECLGVCCQDFRGATDEPCGLGGKEPLRAALTGCLFFLQHPLLKPVLCACPGEARRNPQAVLAGRTVVIARVFPAHPFSYLFFHSPVFTPCLFPARLSPP